LCRSATLPSVLHVFPAPVGKCQDSTRLWSTAAASFHILTGCFFSISSTAVIGPPLWCVKWRMYVYLVVSYTQRATCKRFLCTSWGYKAEPVHNSSKLLLFCSSLMMAQS
jgi:hypothetical protein